MAWPLLLALALVVLTPVALIAPTLVSPQSAINTVIGGKRLFMGRTRGGVPAPPGVQAMRVVWGHGWLFTIGTPEKYLIFFGDGIVIRNADDTMSVAPPLARSPLSSGPGGGAALQK